MLKDIEGEDEIKCLRIKVNVAGQTFLSYLKNHHFPPLTVLVSSIGSMAQTCSNLDRIESIIIRAASKF